MMIHKELNVAFLMGPRTASRSLEAALGKRLDFERVGAHHHGPGGMVSRAEDYDPSCRYFTVVRNHWDTIVSWAFKERELTLLSQIDLAWLVQFINNNPGYFRPGGLWWFLRECPRLCVLRYENLEAEFAAALRAVGLGEAPPLMRINEGYKRLHYRHHLSDECARWIAKAFREEIALLGYEFGG